MISLEIMMTLAGFEPANACMKEKTENMLICPNMGISPSGLSSYVSEKNFLNIFDRIC